MVRPEAGLCVARKSLEGIGDVGAGGVLEHPDAEHGGAGNHVFHDRTVNGVKIVGAFLFREGVDFEPDAALGDVGHVAGVGEQVVVQTRVAEKIGLDVGPEEGQVSQVVGAAGACQFEARFGQRCGGRVGGDLLQQLLVGETYGPHRSGARSVGRRWSPCRAS